jgi:hypothetical protein
MPAERSEWRLLLDLALPALDHVFGPPDEGTARNHTPDWTLGGGTAIMLHIRHRISHDIDIFVPGTRLKLFTPATNPAAARISGRFQWPGHYLKFERPEGEIDFLSAMLQTKPGFTWSNLKGRPIAVETPEEVIVKKIRFRSHGFTARDAFDLAAVAAVRPGLDRTLRAETPDALPRLAEALRILERQGYDALAKQITPIGMGVALLPTALERARHVVDCAASNDHHVSSPARPGPALRPGDRHDGIG